MSMHCIFFSRRSLSMPNTMGAYFAKTSSEMRSEIDEDAPSNEEDLGVQLTVLRDSMIHLRVQFFHFQSVFKILGSEQDPNRMESEVKAFKLVIKVVQNMIENLKKVIGEYTERRNQKAVNERIEEFDFILSQIALEVREFERDNFLIERVEKLIEKLNPFDVPNAENLDEEAPPNAMGSLNALKTMMSEESKKRNELIWKKQLQNEEENKIRFNNIKIANGQRKIYKIFRKPVILLVNYLEDEQTLHTLQMLNENQIDYSIFDVSTDSEVRLIAKDLSDCETFPQLFVKGNFEPFSNLSKLISQLPKLYSDDGN